MTALFGFGMRGISTLRRCCWCRRVTALVLSAALPWVVGVWERQQQQQQEQQAVVVLASGSRLLQ
jgi:hypothetical protein